MPKTFYDRSVTGQVRVDRRTHRGVQPQRFYVREDPLRGMSPFLMRAARDPWMLALTVFGFGFVAVFVDQAPILVQIVLGAPIFEELVKLGLALLLANAVTFVLSGFRMDGWQHPAWLAVRLPLALAVGAGFGFLEHSTTYSEEDFWSYLWRVLFHSLSAGASMIVLQAVLQSRDVRTRWLAPLPSMFIHYLNNYAALLFGVGSLQWPGLGTVALWWSQVLVVVLGLAFIAALAVPGRVRGLLERVAIRLQLEGWAEAAARETAAASGRRRHATGR